MVAVTFLTGLYRLGDEHQPACCWCRCAPSSAGTPAKISAPFGLRILLYGMMAPFAAALMLRYGIRATVSTALVMILAGLGLASQVHALWQLWLTWGVLIGLGAGMTAMWWCSGPWWPTAGSPTDAAW